MDLVFYDGACGLCHGVVKFAVRRDSAARLHYAPLRGPTFEREMPAGLPILPDSVVLLTAENEILVRSDAVVAILRRLPPPWPSFGALIGVVPRFLRDAGYAFVARIRGLLFRKPAVACPLVPAPLRDRFEP